MTYIVCDIGKETNKYIDSFGKHNQECYARLMQIEHSNGDNKIKGDES